MKKLILFIAIAAAPFSVAFALDNRDTTQKIDKEARANIAPDDTVWKINVLKAPSSPGAALLGISPSAIQRPTDPSAFMVSLLNASDNFTTIPNSYAVDFAPAWLFSGKNITFDSFKSNKVGNNIWQSLDISFAVRNEKDTVTDKTNTGIGLGLKVSILRGNINRKALQTVDRMNRMISNFQRIKSDLEIKVRDRPGYRQLSPEQKGALIDSAHAVVRKIFRDSLDAIKKVGEQLDFARYGWKLDLAGGTSVYFPGQTGGRVSNAGAWLTGGYEDEGARIAFLGIARYLYNPDQAYADPAQLVKQANLSTLDFGNRFLYATKDTKFTFGAEFVYRSILNNTQVGSSVRYTFNTDYEIGKNQIISFVFGRDFDGTINKKGNLLAALNFIIGFGNNRSVH